MEWLNPQIRTMPQIFLPIHCPEPMYDRTNRPDHWVSNQQQPEKHYRHRIMIEDIQVQGLFSLHGPECNLSHVTNLDRSRPSGIFRSCGFLTVITFALNLIKSARDPPSAIDPPDSSHGNISFSAYLLYISKTLSLVPLMSPIRLPLRFSCFRI